MAPSSTRPRDDSLDRTVRGPIGSNIGDGRGARYVPTRVASPQIRSTAISAAEDLDHKLDATRYAVCAEQLRHMVFDVGLGDPQLSGNFFVGSAVTDKVEYPNLTADGDWGVARHNIRSLPFASSICT